MIGVGKGRIDGAATAATLGALACWTVGPNFIHYLSNHFDPYSQSFWRYLVAALLWLPHLLIMLRRGKADRRVWKGALLPMVANVAMQTCWISALYHIQPGFGSLITKVGVLWTAGLSFIFFVDERVLLRSTWFWMGLVLSLAGVTGVIVFREEAGLGASWKGIVLAQMGTFFWSCYTVAVKRTLRDIPVRVSFSVISIYSMLALGVIALLFGESDRATPIEWRPWAGVVISAILSIGLAHVFYYAAIRRIGATLPGVLLLSSPLWVGLVSWLWFGENLTAKQMGAGLVLLVGAGMALRAQEKMVKLDI